ncbi:MAG: CBS domain-containing protein [Nitrospirota bacterium]
MKVGEIMTKEVHTIGPEQTLKECAEVLKNIVSMDSLLWREERL